MTLRERLKQCWARRPRLHRSSVVVGLLAAGVFVLLAYPGEGISYAYETSPRDRSWLLYAHGWPWQWYDRWVVYDNAPSRNSLKLPTHGEVSWLNHRAWLLSSNEDFSFRLQGFDATALAKDSAIGLVGVFLVTSGWETRRRRRRSAWQFTLRDCLVSIAVFGLLFGYCAHLQRTHANDVRCDALLRELGCQTNLDSVPDWTPEPAWLRRLVGAERVPEWFSHVNEVDMWSISAEKVENVMPYLENLNHLETIMIEDAHERPLPVAHFARLSSLRELQIREYEPLDDETVEQLKMLTQLDKMSITYASSLTDTERRELEQALPHCEIVAHSDQ